MRDDIKISVKFEVYGKLEGVSFTNDTLKKAKELGLRGLCLITIFGSVLGIIEGPAYLVEKMKEWLQYVGSHYSKIEKVEFRGLKEISESRFSDFRIKE